MSASPDPVSTEPGGPRREHTDGAAAPANASPRQDDLINILIVDDEPANLVVLETVLDDPGYRLVRAQTSDEALLALVREDFALLILDVRMPVMTGFELAAMIKQRRKTARVPIIFLTAYYDKDQHALEGYETGAVDYLNKPVNPAVLRSKVAVFADLHRKSQEILLANRALLSEVSERRRAEEELRDLNETLELRVSERTEALHRADHKLQALMNSITDGLFTLDHDWRFSYINDQGAQLLGKRADELLHGQIWQLFPALRQAEFDEGLRRAVQAHQTVTFEAFHGEPLNRWFRCHCYPSEEGLSVYFHDVTERRNVEQRRQLLLEAEQAARNEGERVARSKDEFLATLSHELRTPLAAMLGWAAVLKRPGADAETLRRGVDAIERNARAQSRLVADLLETSRVVSGKLRMTLAPLDLNHIALAAVDTARPAAQTKGVALHFEESDAPIPVMGDATRLEQVVANLLTNSLKFTPPAGTITVRTGADGTRAFLSVADTGQGIEAQFLPHLFKRFSQADGSAARVHGGLGLGLSIAKHLVELHQGSIAAASAGAGAGATVTFTLPLACASPLAQVAPEGGDDSGAMQAGAPRLASLESASLDGASVLLVDDHVDVLEVESRLLAEYGARVTTATSAEQALGCLRTGTHDVLVSDLGMPGMDGYALIEHIRTVLRVDEVRLPAIAVTAFVRPDDWDRAILAGYQKCLQKPVSHETLASAISGLLTSTDRTEVIVPAVDSAMAPSAGESTGPARRLRTLFVEDSPELQDVIGCLLEEEGLDLVTCGDAESAHVEFRKGGFDFVVTDVNLPGISGVALAKQILVDAPMTWVVFSTGKPMGESLAEFGPRARLLPKPFRDSAIAGAGARDQIVLRCRGKRSQWHRQARNFAVVAAERSGRKKRPEGVSLRPRFDASCL